MAKTIETTTAQRKREEMTAWRAFWQRHNRVVAVMGCAVAMATSIALMVPVFSFTENAADEVGVVLDKHADETVASDEVTTGHETAEITAEEEASEEAVESSSAEADDKTEAQVVADEESTTDQIANDEAENVVEQNEVAEDAGSEIAVATTAEELDVNNADSEAPEASAQSFRAELKESDDKVALAVSVEAPEGAFPADANMTIDGVATDEVQAKVEEAVRSAFGDEVAVTKLTAVDIAFIDAEGNELEPAENVEVKITAECVRDYSNPVLVHVLDESKANLNGEQAAEIINDVKIVNEDEERKTVGTENTMKFEAEAFSPYVIAEVAGIEGAITTTAADDAAAADAAETDSNATAERHIVTTADPDTRHALSARSGNYKVTVTYGADAEVPAGARLAVEEIDDASREYEEYAAAAEDALGMEEGSAVSIRLLDIKIVDADDSKVEIAAPVDVKIKLADGAELASDAQVVHFADDAETPDVVADVDVAKAGDAVSFEADGFSAYAIVEGPSPESIGWQNAASIAELIAKDSQGLYIGHTDGYYFTSGITKINASRTGITKTKPAQGCPPADAVPYYFEPVTGTAAQIKAYCLDANGKKYVVQSGNSLNFTTDEAQANIFTIELFGNEANTFRIKGDGGYYWNMQGGANGKSFAAYNDANDTNARLRFWYKEEVTTDPYNLDGKSYGLMNWNGGPAGKAMMAKSSTANTLDADFLTVMANQGDNKDKLFVPKDSDISMWTFEWVSDDCYHLKATVDGSTRYLKIDNAGLSLVSVLDDTCLIQVVPGTGVHAGEVCLKSADGMALTYNRGAEDAASAFSVGGSTGSEWLRFAEISELTSDYFRTYSARKVSISAVPNGEKIIVYTRFWNDDAKRYEIYAINSDGSLVPCFESGDSIEWVGGQMNTLLWNLTEYYNEGTTEPNGFYELYNQYSGRYIAPQVTNGQILAPEPIGINLVGRQNGKYYTSILAWDDDNYAYAGYKVVDDGNGEKTIVSCTKPEAMDFYFAIVEDIPLDDTLHTVPTVDHVKNGITMKIKDFGTRKEMSDFLGNDAGGVGNTLHQGLLSTELSGDYPTAKGGSLASLFAGAQSVNHLFIDSTYRASGYYEFDSAQNFASLGKDGNFKVYKELGSYDTGGDRPTLKHGQFFPYNDLEPGIFATVNGENLYSATAVELPESDPRKYEQLYLIKDANCYYGMELEASFVQTPSGLDAWGHDIIYEFTGDDDFWLYVDGELVIDLGGIHSAVPGSVNFRTGQVNVNGKNTTLRDLFIKNYKGRGHSEAEAQAHAKDIFELNAEGNYVFKDNTTHTMRIFYMERGAGAANLHMRFNLASVKPGTVQLSKELEGVDATESIMAEFPYQIFYKATEGSAEQVVSVPDSNVDVYYKDTNTPVASRQKIEVGGVAYNNVFMLKPGETAEINFPTYGEDNTPIHSYRIVECGVNTDVYSSVSVNGIEVEGAPVGTQGNREDYGIDWASTKERATVAYKNTVDPAALRTLTITKKLYDETGKHEPEHEVRNSDAAFNFRLYLATEFDGALHEMPANMQTYHVKDMDANYCSWNAAEQKFEKIGSGIQNYADLTPEQKVAASFTTSMNGSISKIPAFYTVEMRNVLAGTQYRVEERSWEIPDGYSFQEYNGYDSANAGVVDRDGVSGVDGVVVSSNNAGKATADPNVGVCNLKGWGLRVNKTWTDADYMTEREAAYFGVFSKNAEGLALVDGTVRQMAYDANPQTLYWYFRTLPVKGVAFENYEIRELKLGNLTVADDGQVTAYDSIEVVENGETIELSGKQKGEKETSDFSYTVHYEKGKISEGSNVRIDTVTNDRPGIVLKKQDWSGHELAGATFTLADEEGEVIGTFTSDDEGLITVAFLREDVSYTLTETNAPQGFQGLPEALVMKLNGGSVTVEGADEAYYELEPNDTGLPTLTVKDRPYTFTVVKEDGDTQERLSGVRFALHRQVTVDGETGIDLNPMPGYENLVTDSDGIVPQLDNALPAGVYQLREIAPAEGYERLTSYVNFSVSATGVVALGECPAGVTLASDPDDEGNVPYVLTIPNVQPRKVSFKKVDIANMDVTLAGAEFDLYKLGQSQERELVVSGLVSGEDGLLAKGGKSVFALERGTYELVETKAPVGYVLKSDPVTITVASEAGDEAVAYDEGTSVSMSNRHGSYDKDTRVYTLTITNASGYTLPNTGGIGTTPMYLLGLMLIAGACAFLTLRCRHVC